MNNGYTNSEIGFIPDDWNLKSLEDVTLPKTGLRRGPFGGALKKEIFVENGYAVYEQQHAIYGDFGQFRYFIDDAKYYEMKAFQTQPGDILISCSGTIGRVAVVPNGCKAGVINQALLRVRTNKKKIDGRFLVFLLTNDVYQNMIVGMTHGSAMKNIVGMDTLRKIPIPLPPLPEQQKIADILTTVDDHISETEALIEKTKVLKQGLMQQLLTKGIGHTEFKDTEIGRIPVKWEVKKTAEISKQLNPGKLFDKSTVKEMGIVPVLSQGVEDYVGYHDEAPGVIASDNSPVITFANHTCALRLMKTPFSCIQNIFPKIGIPGVCETIYFYYATTGKVTMTAYKGHHPLFREIKIPLPPLSEQRQIAAILTSVDDQIDTYQAKLASLTKLKSGLMQQLLTGKIRVKV